MENEDQQDIDLENNDLEVTLEDESQEAVEEDTTDWKAEALKQKAIAQRLSQKLKPSNTLLKKEVAPDLTQRLSNLESLEKKRQFGYEHGLSPEETDAIFKINSNPTKEDLENPFVKGGLDALRAKKRVAENTPTTSSRSITFNGKDVKEVFKDDKISKEEKQKAWEKVIGKK